MPKYKAGEEKIYFPAIIAGLIVISIALAYFIYSLITAFEKPILEEALIEGPDGTTNINPTSSLQFPTAEPNLAQPGYPPPL